VLGGGNGDVGGWVLGGGDGGVGGCGGGVVVGR